VYKRCASRMAKMEIPGITVAFRVTKNGHPAWTLFSKSTAGAGWGEVQHGQQ
jgi:hypothetical protein